jgi:hypothetical protein
MIDYLKRIIKNITNNNKNKKNKTDTLSYGDFLKKYPNSTKDERRNAIQKFLNSTRK